MADDLTALEDWAGGLLAQLAPGARRKAAKTIATALRKSQQQRIKAQQNPDGSPFAPRKLRAKKNRVKRGAMFAKLRTAKYLKAKATPEAATVEFTAAASRIAAVHQSGGVDRASPRGPLIRYPRRRLLGFASGDRAMIRDVLLDHLSR